MAYPANTSTVVVLGTFITPEGDASTGSVTFTASSWLDNSGANLSIPNSSVTKALGTAGDFSVTLPITDDPDLTPLEFVYSVSELVDGVSRNYNISIPGTVAAGGTVYLADLAPVAAAGPEYYSLASSLSIGTVTTLAAGSAATATITGLAPEQTLDLGIPQGVKGDTGDTGPQGSAATIAVGTVTSGTAGGTPTVTNSGTSGAAVLDFVLIPGDTGPTGPTGTAATISVGTVTSGTAGGTPTVTNSGTSSAAVLDFVLIPGDTGPQGIQGIQGVKGDTGDAATIEVGTVTTGTAGGTASVTNSGTTGSAVFDFVIPRGDTGATGPTGTAATISVGTVGSVAYGGTATVTNSGTSGAAVLDFTVVTGPTGGTAPLEDGTPEALGTAAAGTANSSARGDHVHSSTVANPTFTGIPVAPTAAVGTDTTQVATTEFVNAEIANDAVLIAEVTAKADLLIGSGNAAIDNLAVGSDGHILTASSGETLGIKWAAPVLTLEDFLLNTDSTEWSLPSLIGRAAFGGFIAGIIDTNQAGSILAEDDYQTPLRYLLIVSPQSLEDSSKAWRTSTATVSGASTRWNGLAAQNALASATYPAFDYCDGLSFPSDGGSKWYLPALDELELCYRNFKPTTDANFDGTRTTDVFPAANFENGLNNASDPQGSDYTTSVPAQTSVSAFQSGGAEAFAAFSYWSASWRGSTTAWGQFFFSGLQFNATQTAARRVRPVRRVVL